MEKIVGIIGLGYVGLPLAIQFVKQGFTVIGIDVDHQKINSLQLGTSYLQTITHSEIKQLIQSGKFTPSDDFTKLKESDVIIICVPTPLKNENEPNLSYIQSAVTSFLPYLKKGHLIILESSTYPGTTEDYLKPLLEDSGLVIGQDIYLGYSPERIDPGNEYLLTSIPKVISGTTDNCLEQIRLIYEQVFETLVPVKSPKIAEMTKLLENTQRFINISFINEMARICERMDVDIWEVIKAASTKPFGFTPYYPGPGIGGHCIPVDPLYLKWKAQQEGIDTSFIDLAKKTNDEQPAYIISRMEKLLTKNSNVTNQPRKVLLVGVTYKPNVNDTRESKAITIFNMLETSGYLVDYHDPYVDELATHTRLHISVPLTKETLRQYDCVIIITNHTNIDYALLLQHSSLLFDTRRSFDENHPHVFRL
ncbi:nucleotide sugar dehydrogenase [Ornithinibacillus contaminans]|uniref:nucleotide sugar dehydrogenase n=1 Tax=Ornithinibacillus contaminans TaxID=694055 RepID=UPI00064E0914|nr:nucleotide sugar dehydrogenase [Ornithinibacillus contaminans]